MVGQFHEQYPIPIAEPEFLYGDDVAACISLADAAIDGTPEILLAKAGHHSEVLLQVSDDEIVTVSRTTDPLITRGKEYLVTSSEASTGITTELALSTGSQMRQPVAGARLWSNALPKREPASGDHLESIVKQAALKIPRGLPVERYGAIAWWQNREMATIGGQEAGQVWNSIEESISHLLKDKGARMINDNPRSGNNWARPDKPDYENGFPISSFMVSWDNDEAKAITAAIVFADCPYTPSSDGRLYVAVTRSLIGLQEVAVSYDILDLKKPNHGSPRSFSPLDRALIHAAIGLQLPKDNLRHHLGREK